ncbi:MAG: hypothetical protein WDN06_18360 [Asticcacaulis sp.]
MSSTIYQSGEIVVSGTAANDKYCIALVMPNGRVMVAWASDGTGGGPVGTSYSFFDPSGSPITPGGFLTGAFGQFTAAALPDGDVIFAWDAGRGTGGGVHGRLLNSNGFYFDSSEFMIVGTDNGAVIQRPGVVGLANSSFVGTWASGSGDSSGYGILGLQFSASGDSNGIFHVNTYTSNDQLNPAIASLAGGGYVVTWESQFQNAGPERRLHADVQRQRRQDRGGNPYQHQFGRRRRRLSQHRRLDRRRFRRDLYLAWRAGPVRCPRPALQRQRRRGRRRIPGRFRGGGECPRRGGGAARWRLRRGVEPGQFRRQPAGLRTGGADLR